VHDAGALQLVAFEHGDHRCVGAAYVQQYWQLELRSQRQLRFEQFVLALDVRVLDVIVQADLADGAEFRLTA